jgi:hydrogenase maturation protease
MSASGTAKKLLIGIGNYGRSDDALGWKFADAVAAGNDSADYDIEYRYQLQIEDALLVSEYDEIIFADASHTQYEGGFSFYKAEPKQIANFTTHSLPPEAILWLVSRLYDKKPKAYVMGITGTNWDLQHGLSSAAQQHLINALDFFNQKDSTHRVSVSALKGISG